MSSPRRTPVRSTEHLHSKAPALIRPLTVALFLGLLAGQFSFERIGRSNPFFVPERLFALGILVFAVLIIVSANRRLSAPGPRGVVLVVSPVAYYFVTALWGPDTPGYWSTVVDVVCMLLSCVILIALLKWQPDTVAVTFLWCMAATGIIFAIGGLASSSVGARVAAFGGGPNVFSRITMLGFIAIVGLIVMRRLPVWAIAVTPLLIVATVASGSRGGMLAGIAGIAVLIPLLGHLKRSQALASIGILAVFAMVVYRRYADVIDQTVSGRIIDLTLQQRYSSGRGELVSAAWEMFQARPVSGWGLTGFADYFGRGFTYPHNLLLQAVAEGGAVSLLFLTVSFAVFIKSARRASVLGLTFTAAATVIFVSSMFSGDYYDTRFLWVFMILVLSGRRTDPQQDDDSSVVDHESELQRMGRKP